MEHRAFLNVAALTNHDGGVVPTDDGIEPDADILADRDIADQHSIRSNEMTAAQDGLAFSQGIQHGFHPVWWQCPES